MKKGKKTLQRTETIFSNESFQAHWYEEAQKQGYLNQEQKNKKVKPESGNRLDSDALQSLAEYKKTLEVQQVKEKQISQAKRKAQEAEKEKATHWYDLAEKNGYLDDY